MKIYFAILFLLADLVPPAVARALYADVTNSVLEEESKTMRKRLLRVEDGFAGKATKVAEPTNKFDLDLPSSDIYAAQEEGKRFLQTGMSIPATLIPDCKDVTCEVDEFVIPLPDVNGNCCSSDPCDACPGDSVCVEPMGKPARCIDCGCGFCHSPGTQMGGPCCEINAAGNNCKSTGQASDCTLANFVDFTSSGNSCQSEEGNEAFINEGCGCVPANDDVCAIEPPEGAGTCFVCRKDDSSCNGSTR